MCAAGAVLQTILRLGVVPLVIGLITGLWSSYCISRRFRKKTLLDECSRLIRRLSPGRRENKREGDGLLETAWGLKIQSEIMAQAGFEHEGQQITKLAEEMEIMPDVEGRQDEEAKRNQRKDEWKDILAQLY